MLVSTNGLRYPRDEHQNKLKQTSNTVAIKGAHVRIIEYIIITKCMYNIFQNLRTFKTNIRLLSEKTKLMPLSVNH